MRIIKLIGWISGIALLLFGFVHLLVLDKWLINSDYYLDFKWWAGKITIALTILFFSSGIAMLTSVLFAKKEK